MVRFRCFFSRPTKKFSPKNEEKIEGRKWDCVNGQKCPCPVHLFTFYFFVLGTLPLFLSFSFFSLDVAFFFSSFSDFLPCGWVCCLFFFLWAVGLIVVMFFFFFFLYFGFNYTWFFFGTCFLFFNKLGDCFFFLLSFFYFIFCGYLSLFCINWPSFFNNGVWVNLYKVQTHFFHPSTFPLPTKQKGKKLKSFLSSHFFILPPFSILQLFHPSNQVDLKSIPSWL